jgi:putative FmdB family regulatory protein
VPTYEYACTACDDRLEVVQRFTDDPLTECPSCTGTLRKVFSAVGVVFKGSGFYKTDSRGSSSAKKSEPSPATSSATSSAPAAPASAPATPPSTGPAPAPAT